MLDRHIVCSWDRQRRRHTEQLQLKWEKRVAGRGWLSSEPWAERVWAVFTSLLCSLQADLLVRAGGLDEQVDWNW